MNRWFASVACLTTLPGMLLAGHCGFVHRPVFHAPVVKKVVKEVAVFRFDAVIPLVSLPTYTLGGVQAVAPLTPTAPVAPPSAPPAVPAPAPATDLRPMIELLQKMNDRLDRMEQRLDALEKKPAAPMPKASSAAPRGSGAALAALQARCASCHTAGSLQKTTLALVNAEGQEMVLDAETKQEVIKRITATEADKVMPPVRAKSPLTDQEKNVLVAHYGM